MNASGPSGHSCDNAACARAAVLRWAIAILIARCSASVGHGRVELELGSAVPCCVLCAVAAAVAPRPPQR